MSSVAVSVTGMNVQLSESERDFFFLETNKQTALIGHGAAPAACVTFAPEQRVDAVNSDVFNHGHFVFLRIVGR
jgi:hypothetical protein